mgnify:CR=1 FL=1
MTDFIIPSIVLLIIFYGLIKGVDIYSVFLDGVKEGLNTALSIFPTIFAMCIAIDVFLKSGILKFIFSPLEIILSFFSIPKEILPLAIIRPISGSSSLILLNDLLKNYGPDSTAGRIASILQGSTDTTIYIIGLYFSSIGVKKIKYSLLVGLFADFCAIIFSILMVKIYFGI